MVFFSISCITATGTALGFLALAITANVGTDHIPECDYSFFGKGVMHPFSFFSDINQVAVTEDFHVMGKSRLRDIQILQKNASTLLTMLQRQHDCQPIFVSQRLDLSNIFSESHGGSPPIDEHRITNTLTFVNMSM
jgi:hypothetical protein